MRGIHEFVERWGTTAVLTGVVAGTAALAITPLLGEGDQIRRTAGAFALGVVLGLDYGILVEWRNRGRHADDGDG